MKENKIGNHKVISTAITTIVFLALVFSATYAIIGATIVYDDANVTGNIASRPIFTSTPSGPIALNPPLVAADTAQPYVVDTANANLSVALSTGYDTTTTCTYDLVWKWKDVSSNKEKYTITTGATKEYTISGQIDSNNKFEEKQLGNYASKTILHSSSITATGSTITTQKWTLTANFYKTVQLQSGHFGGVYAGQVVVENVICSNAN